MFESQVTVEILKNDRYAGAIESVRKVTDFIDIGFGWVITLTAFLIIIVAMLKNILAGAYCAYPKFWDKVDEAHKEVEGIGWQNGFKPVLQAYTKDAGSVSGMLYRILPNIRALTDFQEQTVRPKTYFTRAIPQMLLCIIIGAFIYNGYYRDTAAKIVDFGSQMTERVLLSFDPVAVYDKVTSSSGRPVFPSDNAVNTEGKLVNKLAKDGYSRIVGTYNDITNPQAKNALALALDGTAVTFCSEADSYASEQKSDSVPLYGEGNYKVKTNVQLIDSPVEVGGMKGWSEDGNVYSFAKIVPVSELGFDSTVNTTKDMWLFFYLQCERTVAKSSGYASRNLTLHLKANSTGEYSITCESLKPQGLPGSRQVGNPTTKLSAWVDSPNGKSTLYINASPGTYDNLNIRLNDSDGMHTHNITKIVIDNNAENGLSFEGSTMFDFNAKNIGTEDFLKDHSAKTEGN